jgi:hypothetical protein
MARVHLNNSYMDQILHDRQNIGNYRLAELGSGPTTIEAIGENYSLMRNRLNKTDLKVKARGAHFTNLMKTV